MARTLLAQWLNSLIQITDDDLLLAWTTPHEKMALRITVEELEQEFQALRAERDMVIADIAGASPGGRSSSWYSHVALRSIQDGVDVCLFY